MPFLSLRAGAVALLALVPLAGCLSDGDPAPEQPYAGLQDSPVRGLSPGQIQALLAGDGAGYALPAELNGFPGPKHVLDHADALGLSDLQRAQVADVRARMLTEAMAAGEALIEAYEDLDAAFRGHDIEAATVEALTAGIGQRESTLRALHLAAHIDTRALLDAYQVALYASIRGYSATGSGHDGHSNEGHGQG